MLVVGGVFFYLGIQKDCEPLLLVPIKTTLRTTGVSPWVSTILGNLLRECGVCVVQRLTKASENEIANIVTLFLGLPIGATMVGSVFFNPKTLIVLGLGFLAICCDTACGVLFGKVMCFLSGGTVNPLIGAAGISAFPISARVVQGEGQKYNRETYLFMHPMGVNAGVQVGSVLVAAVMVSVLSGMRILP